MAITGWVTRFLAEEHKYRPLPSTVHLLGRQTIQVGLEGIRQIMSEVGVSPREVEIAYETATRQAGEKGAASISDRSFFELFGVEKVIAIDHSDFEGAEIVFDLTGELPEGHVGIAEFIFDGSVMDNVFDPASAMRNVAKLLKPGGRYVGINVGSTRWLPAYLAFNPYWFFDFFVVNRFADVKVYVLDFRDYDHHKSWLEGEVFLLDARADHRNVHNFPMSHGFVCLLIIAEKADDSSSDQRTSQGVYRLEEEWSVFEKGLERVMASPRPPVQFRRHANNRGGSQGFSYVGTIDSFGLFSRDPGLSLPVLSNVVVNLGKPFSGYGWGALGEHQGIGWRWVDGHSVILVNPTRNRKYRIEAQVHTALDLGSITNLQLGVNGARLNCKVIENAGRYVVLAEIDSFPVGESPIEIDFYGQGLAISEFRLTPVSQDSSAPKPSSPGTR